jgi:uncharacterized protein YjbI with pentapeptide repeats
MKVVKPTVVSFTHRTLLLLGQQRLSTTCMIGFALGSGERRLVTDGQLWDAIGESTAGIADEGLPKANGEVLIFGYCHAPGGRPVPLSYVRVRVAPSEPDPKRTVDKKLFVFGDREWKDGVFGKSMTDPVPFTTMPLGWERAFGGETYPKNPLGRGIAPGEGTDAIPLPNVEEASSHVDSPSARPEPAGFGLIEMGWPQRQSKAGTYDDRWLEEDFPGYARDTDPSFFNGAAADQRIHGVFRGDEEYLLENLNPSHPIVRGRLPAVCARVVLRRKGSRVTEEVKMQLDTLIFLPEKAIGILVYRGTTPVLEDDAEDIALALAACEDLNEPRPPEHYTRALDARLDKEMSPILALMSEDLVPPFAAETNAAGLGLPVDFAQAMSGEQKPVLDEARERLTEAGVDASVPGEASAAAPVAPPPEPVPREQPVPPPNEGPIAKTQRLQVPTLETPLPAAGQGPPKLEAPRLMAALEEGAPPDADVTKKLEELKVSDARAIASYRTSAHFNAPVRRLTADERDRARTGMRELRAQGVSFAGLDWTRFDLSGYDLQKGDFRKTLLEGADLSGTNVAGSDMSGAVLAHATLHKTCFDGAVLEGTNLGSAQLEGASLVGANLRKAIFVRAKLLHVCLKGADLTGIDWLEAELGAVDFEEAITGGLDFLPGHDLTRCRFPRARLAKSNFLETKLDGVDFAGADMTSVTFLGVSANGADFRGASMTKFVAVEACSFEGANFAGANLTGSLLRGANLRGANFEGAHLDGVNLSGSDLTGANLTDTQAKEAILIRANLTDATLHGSNLMEAMLQKSTLRGADLSGTNLFLSNLSLTHLDTGTKLSGANLKRALMVPRARKAP